MVPVIIDIIIVVILLVSLLRGISKGLILSVVSLVAVVVVFFGARWAADNYSDRLDTVIGPFVANFVDETTTQERVDRGIEYSSAGDAELRAAAESIYKKLGVWQGKANTMADDAVESFRANDITFKNAVSARFVSALAYIFAFLIAYLLLNIVFAVIINLCNVIFKLPGLKMLNGIGGAVLGLAVGLLIVFAIAWAARYLSFLLGDFVGKTKVLKFFAENNPFNSWLSI